MSYAHASSSAQRLARQAERLRLLSEHVRAHCDVRQVRITEEGVEDLPSLAGELWLIHFDLFAIAADLCNTK